MSIPLLETLAVSLRPDVAMTLATGNITIQLSTELLMVGGTEDPYKGRILIHACKYLNQDEEREGYRRLVENGWNAESAPVNSILGWAKIKDVKPYNPQTFAIDAEKHGYGSDLVKFQQDQGWIGRPVYGYFLHQIHLLKTPIMGVGSEEYQHGTFWAPRTPFEVMTFKMAFDRDAVDIDAVDAEFQ